MLYAYLTYAARMIPAFIIAAVALAGLYALGKQASRGSSELFDIMEQQATWHRLNNEAHERTFQRAVLAVSDATAKAVQSIVMPETLSTSSQVMNDQLPAVREMPTRERDMSWDFSDPTDHDPLLQEDVLRPDTAVLGDPNSPMGIPGFAIDPERYSGGNGYVNPGNGTVARNH